ncbi:unnamed protein product [marine sediment metagenome]|uniref:Uncharacterized protein n=1 Tax=marine sediment metagenome TaxID=412755 RepID=X1CEN1_9ZZZZ
MTLAIQNTRNLVLDVSAMMGQKYDLSQVTWLGTLNNYLEHFNTYTERYKNNPEAVFWDLAELIERPAQDAKGALQQSVLSGLETALNFAKTVGEGFMTIGIDIEKLYDDLPQFIKDQVPDPGEVFWDNMEGFLNTWYTPTITALETSISDWQGRLTESQNTVSDLVKKLRKPGDLVAGMDALPAHERIEQENLLAVYSNKVLNRLSEAMAPSFSFAAQELAVAARIPVPPSVVAPALSYEPVTATVAAPGAVVPRSTWFVGNY